MERGNREIRGIYDTVSVMRIILTKDVPALGQKDDLKTVADGYARNFLLPRGLAMPASEAAIRAWEERKKTREAESAENLKHVEELVKKLNGYELGMTVKANEEGTLYSAIGASEVIAALKAKGFEMARAVARLAEPLKSLGKYEAALEFPDKLEARITVILAAEKEKRNSAGKEVSKKTATSKRPKQKNRSS